jgi:hypothetical protein
LKFKNHQLLNSDEHECAEKVTQQNKCADMAVFLIWRVIIFSLSLEEVKICRRYFIL